MAKRKEKNISFRKYVFVFLIIFLIILIFTFMDYLIHSISKEYAVPSYYFKNKIIFGMGIGFISYLFLKRLSCFAKSLFFSLIISILLQIRYFLEGYSIKFVLEFLVIHFLILFVVSLIVFKLLENKILKGGEIR